MRELALNSSNINEFDILFRNLIGHDLSNGRWKQFQGVKPGYPVDLYYTDDTMTIEVPVIGARIENIKVVRSGDELSVSYHRDKENEKFNANVNWVHRGIVRRDFDMAWKISPKFNLKELTSTIKNGLLTITIPAEKSQLPEEVKINILD